jgi:hypothetical protein
LTRFRGLSFNTSSSLLIWFYSISQAPTSVLFRFADGGLSGTLERGSALAIDQSAARKPSELPRSLKPCDVPDMAVGGPRRVP